MPFFCDSVMLEWDYVAEEYELSVTHDDGTQPEEDTIYGCSSTFKGLTGLDTATWYVARVRSLCDNGLVSEWSDSVHFYVPGDTCANNGEGGEILIMR